MEKIEYIETGNLKLMKGVNINHYQEQLSKAFNFCHRLEDTVGTARSDLRNYLDELQELIDKICEAENKLRILEPVGVVVIEGNQDEDHI